MNDLEERIQQLNQLLNIEAKKERIGQLEAELGRPEVWDDPASAGKMARELTELKKMVSDWQNVHDLIAAGETEDWPELEEELNRLEAFTLLSGPYDDLPAIVSIHAGTGGIDAQDWAEMLLKMYLKFTEKRDWQATTLELSPGEEAGIKSTTVRINGDHAYGLLRGESGVHRLVRLSPFNAKNLRQTSFALVEVIPEIPKTKLTIPDSDIRVDVYRASGHGGQGVNTTDSAVRLTHLPTGIVVTCQNERSQMQNKETAMRILAARLSLALEKENQTEISALKPNVQGSWGNQIRSYVFQPYTLVKDHRTGFESSDVASILDGELESFIQAELRLQ